MPAPVRDRNEARHPNQTASANETTRVISGGVEMPESVPVAWPSLTKAAAFAITSSTDPGVTLTSRIPWLAGAWSLEMKTSQSS